jgi:hypothetical protein
MLVSYINAQSWDHFPDLLQRKFVGFSLFKMSLSNPDKELIQIRILKLATAYNTGDIDAAFSVFVDDGLDYSDYGTYVYPLFVPPSPSLSHPYTDFNNTNRDTKGSTHSTCPNPHSEPFSNPCLQISTT